MMGEDRYANFQQGRKKPNRGGGQSGGLFVILRRKGKTHASWDSDHKNAGLGKPGGGRTA